MFLPCTLWGEKTGTVTNLEGRVQRVGRKVAPEGTAMDDWRIATELAFRLGHDFDLATVDEVADEIAPCRPRATRRRRRAAAPRARRGRAAACATHLDEIVLRTGDLTIMAEDGQGVSWDPIKVEGEVPEDPTEVVADVEPEVTAAAPAPEPPALYEWDRRISDGNIPPRDSYALRLVSGRTLYDGGRLVAETPLLATLAPTPRAAGEPARTRAARCAERHRGEAHVDPRHARRAR